jgi:hypothetical protein
MTGASSPRGGVYRWLISVHFWLVDRAFAQQSVELNAGEPLELVEEGVLERLVECSWGRCIGCW